MVERAGAQQRTLQQMCRVRKYLGSRVLVTVLLFMLRVHGLDDVNQPWLVCRVLVRHEMSFCAGGASRFSAGGRIGLYALCELPCMFVRVEGGALGVGSACAWAGAHMWSTCGAHFGGRWSTILRIL